MFLMPMTMNLTDIDSQADAWYLAQSNVTTYHLLLLTLIFLLFIRNVDKG